MLSLMYPCWYIIGRYDARFRVLIFKLSTLLGLEEEAVTAVETIVMENFEEQQEEETRLH